MCSEDEKMKKFLSSCVLTAAMLSTSVMAETNEVSSMHTMQQTHLTALSDDELRSTDGGVVFVLVFSPELMAGAGAATTFALTTAFPRVLQTATSAGTATNAAVKGVTKAVCSRYGQLFFC
jgi:hypothetical protein